MNSLKHLAQRGAFMTARMVIALIGGISATTSEATVELDPTFHYSDDPRVQSAYWCHLLPDGKILAGGFNAFRLNADGSLDTTYPVITTPSSFINKPVLEPDGGFTAFGTYYDEIQRRVVPFLQRFGPGGALDASFQPVLSQFSNPKLLQRDAAGRYLIADETYGLRRLLSDGSVDPTFQPLLNFAISAFAPIGAGQWAVIGLRGVSDTLLRLDDDGAVLAESAIASGPSERPFLTRTLLPLPNGRLLLGGEYPMVGMLRSNGTIDSAFHSIWGEGPDDPAVSSMVRLSNGRFLVGAYRTGSYLSHTPEWPLLADREAAWAGHPVFRVLPDGMLDLSFDLSTANEGAQYAVTDLVVQPDGKFLTTDSLQVHRYIETPSLPVFSFRVKTATVNENASFAAITIYRGGDVTNRGSVLFSTGGGDSTATPWREYWPIRARFHFDRGEWKRTVFVPLRDDSVADGTKNIVVSLSQPDAGSQLYSVSAATIEILDNEE